MLFIAFLRNNFSKKSLKLSKTAPSAPNLGASYPKSCPQSPIYWGSGSVVWARYWEAPYAPAIESVPDQTPSHPLQIDPWFLYIQDFLLRFVALTFTRTRIHSLPRRMAWIRIGKTWQIRMHSPNPLEMDKNLDSFFGFYSPNWYNFFGCLGTNVFSTKYTIWIEGVREFCFTFSNVNHRVLKTSSIFYDLPWYQCRFGYFRRSILFRTCSRFWIQITISIFHVWYQRYR